MKWLAVFLMIAGSAAAQSFDVPQSFTADGVTASAAPVDTCLSTLIDTGPEALVTQEARDCIGQAAANCPGDVAQCAAIERSYWEWRIAQSYQGLAAWIEGQPVSPEREILRATVANPQQATANVPLECGLRINLKNQPETAVEDVATCMMRETALIALELEFTVRQACAGAVEGAFAVFCEKDTE